MVVLSLTLSISYGQDSVDEIFSKYSGRDGYSTVSVSKYMLMLASSAVASTDTLLSKTIDGIDNIRVLKSDRGAKDTNFASDLFVNLPKSGYREMLSVDENGQKVICYSKQNRAIVSDLIFVVSSKSENIIISIDGVVDINGVAKLAKTLGVPQMSKLSEIKL